MAERKTTSFAGGIVVGLAIALLVLLLAREAAPPVFAQSSTGSGTASVPNAAMVTGMSQQNQADMVFILSVDGRENKHLTAYRCENGRDLKLIATRNITWDLQIPGALNSDRPSVAEVKKQVEDALKKMEEALKNSTKGSDKQ